MKKIFLILACLAFSTFAFASNDISKQVKQVPLDFKNAIEWPTRIECSVEVTTSDGTTYTYSTSAWGWNANDAGAKCAAKLSDAMEDRE